MRSPTVFRQLHVAVADDVKATVRIADFGGTKLDDLDNALLLQPLETTKLTKTCRPLDVRTRPPRAM